MKNYYRLNLTNSNAYCNDCVSLLYSDNDYMGITIRVIGEEKEGKMYDLLTGIEIKEVDVTEVLPTLTYYQKEKAFTSDIIELNNQLKENKLYFSGYVNALNHILEKNKEEYHKYIESLNELKELRNENEKILSGLFRS